MRGREDSSSEFANFMNWEMTTETPITNGMEQQGRLHDAPEVVTERVAQHPSNICTSQKLHLVSLIPYHRETDFFRHLNAIGRQWEGPSTSLGIQEIPSLDKPVAVSLEQASSFITEAREAVATGSRSETTETAIRHDITGPNGVTDTCPQGAYSLQREAPHGDHRRE